jgi:putative nucleotidyltransferase with HDIG domain
VTLPPKKPDSPRGGTTKLAPEYGNGVPCLEVSGLEASTGEELQSRLLEIFRSPRYTPPVLPRVAMELTELTRKPSASYDDVVMVLQKDPLIVAGVMSVAQSPLYAGRSPLQSLKEAVQRLGINSLRDIVWQVVAGMRLFRVKGFTEIMERLQAHSMFMAYAARIVAAQAGIAGEHAFLCGLLHDVGISGTLIALAETEKDDVPIMSLLDAIDGMHEQAGGLMAKQWRLSPEIVAVIEHHHHFDPNRTGVPLLTAVLCVAEQLADDLNFGIMESARVALPFFDRHAPGRYLAAVARLKLEDKLGELRSRAEEIAERLQALT